MPGSGRLRRIDVLRLLTILILPRSPSEDGHRWHVPPVLLLLLLFGLLLSLDLGKL